MPSDCQLVRWNEFNLTLTKSVDMGSIKTAIGIGMSVYYLTLGPLLTGQAPLMVMISMYRGRATGPVRTYPTAESVCSFSDSSRGRAKA